MKQIISGSLVVVLMVVTLLSGCEEKKEYPNEEELMYICIEECYTLFDTPCFNSEKLKDRICDCCNETEIAEYEQIYRDFILRENIRGDGVR